MTDAIKELPTSGTDSAFFSGRGSPLRSDFNLVACFGSFLQNPTYFRKPQGFSVLKTGHFYHAFLSVIQHSVIKLTGYINCKGYSFNCLENISCIVNLLIFFFFIKGTFVLKIEPPVGWSFGNNLKLHEVELYNVFNSLLTISSCNVKFFAY